MIEPIKLSGRFFASVAFCTNFFNAIDHACLYSILSAKESGSYIKQYAVDCSDWELLEIVFNILNEETKGMAKGVMSGFHHQ
jgi:hypothetical protein